MSSPTDIPGLPSLAPAPRAGALTAEQTPVLPEDPAARYRELTRLDGAPLIHTPARWWSWELDDAPVLLVVREDDTMLIFLRPDVHMLALPERWPGPLPACSSMPNEPAMALAKEWASALPPISVELPASISDEEVWLSDAVFEHTLNAWRLTPVPELLVEIDEQGEPTSDHAPEALTRFAAEAVFSDWWERLASEQDLPAGADVVMLLEGIDPTTSGAELAHLVLEDPLDVRRLGRMGAQIMVWCSSRRGPAGLGRRVAAIAPGGVFHLLFERYEREGEAPEIQGVIGRWPWTLEDPSAPEWLRTWTQEELDGVLSGLGFALAGREDTPATIGPAPVFPVPETP